jgi:hypothetical protein
MMKTSFLMTFGIALLGCGMCLAQSEQPSLAELAKENKNAHKGGKTFTDADLPSTRAGATVTVTAAPAGQAASNETTQSTVASAEKKEHAKEASAAGKDRPAVAELKRQIESYQQEQDVWKSSVKRYEELLSNETNDFRRQMYEDALQNDKKNVVFYQEKLDQAKTELVNAQKGTPSGASAGAAAQP